MDTIQKKKQPPVKDKPKGISLKVVFEFPKKKSTNKKKPKKNTKK
jgi:hypothetical protein